MGNRPTMNDVAREAGVGLKTVSRYVNGETNIDPALVSRISLAIAGLGYRRNLSAASIRPGWSSKTIGLIISDLANPYYAVLSRAVERVAASEGYMVMTSSSEEDGQLHDRIVDRMLEQRVDGLIVVPPRSAARDWSVLAPPVPPIVFADRPDRYDEGRVVLADNQGGARDAVQALINIGTRRIAFIGDALGIYTMRERFAGYTHALADARLAQDASLVHDGAHGVAEAAAIAHRLLDEGIADAIFAANNRAAIGVLQTFRARGRRVPLIGFDDFEGADLLIPGVSVVSQDVDGMGSLATQLILRALTGVVESPRVTTLPTTLILRGSELPAA